MKPDETTTKWGDPIREADERLAAKATAPQPAPEVCPECNHNAPRDEEGRCLEYIGHLVDPEGPAHSQTTCMCRCVFPPTPEQKPCSKTCWGEEYQRTFECFLPQGHDGPCQWRPAAAPAVAPQPAGDEPHPNDWKYALSFALADDFPDDLHIKILDALEPYFNARVRTAEDRPAEQARVLDIAMRSIAGCGCSVDLVWCSACVNKFVREEIERGNRESNTKS